MKTIEVISQEIIGKTVEEAEKCVLENGFLFSQSLMNCQFKNNRIQYVAEDNIVVSAFCG